IKPRQAPQPDSSPNQIATARITPKNRPKEQRRNQRQHTDPCHLSSELGRRDAQTAAPQARRQKPGSRNQVSDHRTRLWNGQRSTPRETPKGTVSSLQKGGDPAAGSPTATLLRLHPSR